MSGMKINAHFIFERLDGTGFLDRFAFLDDIRVLFGFCEGLSLEARHWFGEHWPSLENKHFLEVVDTVTVSAAPKEFKQATKVALELIYGLRLNADAANDAYYTDAGLPDVYVLKGAHPIAPVIALLNGLARNIKGGTVSGGPLLEAVSNMEQFRRLDSPYYDESEMPKAAFVMGSPKGLECLKGELGVQCHV